MRSELGCDSGLWRIMGKGRGLMLICDDMDIAELALWPHYSTCTGNLLNPSTHILAQRPWDVALVPLARCATRHHRKHLCKGFSWRCTRPLCHNSAEPALQLFASRFSQLACSVLVISLQQFLVFVFANQPSFILSTLDIRLIPPGFPCFSIIYRLHAQSIVCVCGVNSKQK